MKQSFTDLLKEGLKRKRATEDACKSILGTNAAVNAFAEFWEGHAADIMVVTSTGYNNWLLEMDFTKEELIAYKQGLGTLGLFFEKCWLEREKVRAKESIPEET